MHHTSSSHHFELADDRLESITLIDEPLNGHVPGNNQLLEIRVTHFRLEGIAQCQLHSPFCQRGLFVCSFTGWVLLRTSRLLISLGR